MSLAAALLLVADLLWYRHQRRRLRVLLLVSACRGRNGRHVLEGVIRGLAGAVVPFRGGSLYVVVRVAETEDVVVTASLQRALRGVRIEAMAGGSADQLLPRGLALAGGWSDATVVFDGNTPLPVWLREIEWVIRTTAKRKAEAGKGKGLGRAN